MKAINLLTIAATLASAAAMTACTTTNGYNATNGSGRAAVQGAVAGAALGVLAKSDGDRNDIGKAAAIGAAAGGATGYVLSTSPNYPYQK